MANASYIFIKGSGEGDKAKKQGYKAFFGPLDKGSAKPSFCYPRLKDDLREEIKGMEKALSDGHVAETRAMKMKLDIKNKKQRLDAINSQEADANQLFKENKDAIMKRREELGEVISAAIPTYSDVQKRRTNPFRIHEMEKKGIKSGPALGEIKKEFQILSALADEETNTSFLQRD